jgi:hypothetical protein
MHVVEGSSVKVDGSDLRPFLPLDLEYVVGGSDELHRLTVRALLDTGSSAPAFPVRSLPPDVRWEHLTPTSIRINGVQDRGFEVRIWHVDLRVFGTRVGRRIFVFGEGSTLNDLLYPVLGLDTLEHFHVAFAWANVPPVFSLVPVGQVEAQPTTRWRLDAATATWEGVVTIDSPELPSGMRIRGPAVPFTGSTPPRLEAPRLNREMRRRLDR